MGLLAKLMMSWETNVAEAEIALNTETVKFIVQECCRLFSISSDMLKNRILFVFGYLSMRRHCLHDISNYLVRLLRQKIEAGDEDQSLLSALRILAASSGPDESVAIIVSNTELLLEVRNAFGELLLKEFTEECKILILTFIANLIDRHAAARRLFLEDCKLVSLLIQFLSYEDTVAVSRYYLGSVLGILLHDSAAKETLFKHYKHLKTGIAQSLSGLLTHLSETGILTRELSSQINSISSIYQ